MPITAPPVRAMSNVQVKYGDTLALAEDITAACNSAQLAATVNEIETTTLASTGKVTTPGQTEWRIECGGPWSKGLDEIFDPDVISPPTTKRFVSIYFGQTGNRVTYTWDPATAGAPGGYISNYTIDATNPSEALTWSGTLVLSGAPTRNATG